MLGTSMIEYKFIGYAFYDPDSKCQIPSSRSHLGVPFRSPGSGSGGLGDRVHHFSGRSLGGGHPLDQVPGGETKEKLGEMGDKYGRMISNGGDDLDQSTIQGESTGTIFFLLLRLLSTSKV